MKKKKGFTLIEITVALAAFSIVMLAITSILISTIKITAVNKKTYDSDSISKVFFESLRENRPARESGNEKKFEGCYISSFGDSSNDTLDEVRQIAYNLFDSTNNSSITKINSSVSILKDSSVTDENRYALCKDASKSYSMAFYVEWKADGYYEIETWCWNNSQGEASLVTRSTFVTPY